MDYPTADVGARLHNGKFTDGDHANSIPASKDSAAYQNMVFDSLIALIVGAGLTPDEAKTDLIYKAVQEMSGVENASLTSAGIVRLSNSITSSSEVFGATPKAVKSVNDALNLLGQVVSNKAAAGHSHSLPLASTLQPGIAQLNNSITSTIQTEAATPYALKTLKDLLTQLIIDNTQSQIIGGIGTYALLSSAVSVYEGNSYAGSSLKYAGASGNAANTLMNYAGANVTGTWRCMGNSVQRQGGWQQHTLFLRIA